MTVIVGLTALESRLTALSTPTAKRQYMGRLGLRTVAEMKRRVARKTGTTGRSIALGPVTPDSTQIRGNRNTLWLDQGTRPHIIRPKRKKALAWAASPAGRRLSGRARVSTRRGENGGLRFAKVVHHPGTRAQPFINASVKAAIAQSGLADVAITAWNGAA